MQLLSMEKDDGGQDGWFGGGSGLADLDSHPRDRQGRPLAFLAGVCLRQSSWLPPAARAGYLLLFVNNELDFENPKDRFSFAVKFEKNVGEPVSGVCPVFSETMKFRLCPFAGSGESYPVHYLGAHYHSEALLRAKEIAAFASNGVSFNDARRKDSCYSHLVDGAVSFEMLAKFGHDLNVGLNLAGRDLLLLCHKDDLACGLLTRCRLVACDSGAG